MNMLGRIAAVTTLALLGGCAGAPHRASDDPVSLPWPDFAPPGPDETMYRVDPDASALLMRVDPEGPMARLGHSHVIGGRVIGGTVVTGARETDARVDLRINVSGLEVDNPDWRAAEGLEADLDEGAISGTRANMRGQRVLDAERHPSISIRSTDVVGPAWLPDVTVRIRLRGVVRELVVPVAVQRAPGRLTASAAFDLLQSDFGIEPFSTAGGALRVSDRVRIRFRIVAVTRAGKAH